MQQKTSINSEIKNIKDDKNKKIIQINYTKLIQKQQEVISSLNNQILLLKSYITINKQNQNQDLFCQQSSIINTSTSSLENTFNKEFQESAAPYKNSQKILKEIIQILDLKNIPNLDETVILDKIKKIKQISQKKQQPIFIERVKQIKMPITIQKIVEKIVEKPVQKIVQKIIYIERENIDDKYSKGYHYRQSDKYEEKTVDSSYNYGLNRTVSEKNFKRVNQDSSREQKVYKPRYDKYQPKIQSKYQSKYEKYSNNLNNRKPENNGNTLIKKRSEVGFNKYNNYKNDYY